MDSSLRGVYRRKRNHLAFSQDEPCGLSIYFYPRKRHTVIEMCRDGRNELSNSLPTEEGEPRCAYHSSAI